MFKILLVVLALAALLHNADAHIDFKSMKELSSKLSDAAERESEDEFAVIVEKIANNMPEDTVFYGAGVSLGKRADLVLVRTQSLYGSQLSLPINPARRIDTDCVYIDPQYSGNVILVTEEPADIKTCEHSSFTYSTTYLPFQPIFAPANTIHTSRPFSRTGSGTPGYARNEKECRLDMSHTVAIDASKVTKETVVTSEKMSILAGSVVEIRYGSSHIKYFSVLHSITPETKDYSNWKHDRKASMSPALKERLAIVLGEYQTTIKN